MVATLVCFVERLVATRFVGIERFDVVLPCAAFHHLSAMKIIIVERLVAFIIYAAVTATLGIDVIVAVLAVTSGSSFSVSHLEHDIKSFLPKEMRMPPIYSE